MNDMSKSKVAIKDKKSETDSIEPTKVKSKVCWDCDYAYFSHSECDWYCSLTRSFTRGYCEVIDE